MTDAVVFDLDGTLVHLPINYDRLFEEFRTIMKIQNIQPVTKTISDLDSKTRQRIFEVWDNAELQALQNKTVNNEGVEIYKRFLKQRKALVTMQGRRLVKEALEQMRMRFDFVVTREDSLDRTEQLKLAAKKLGVDVRNVLFVGNTEGDSAAAAQLECMFMRVGK